MTWEVGKTYLTRGIAHSRAKVRILANDLKSTKPIAGVLTEPYGDDEELWAWFPNGSFREFHAGSLDLTTEEAAP